VHALLRDLERVGFAGAPRFLGIDEIGREILTYIEGDVPDNISPSFRDRQLVEAAELLRRYHTTRPPSPCSLGTRRSSATTTCRPTIPSCSRVDPQP